MMKLLNSLTFIILLMALTSCLDDLPKLGNENFCPGTRLEDGTCPSAKSNSLGWNFSNISNYSFNSDYLDVNSNGVSLRAIDTNFSGDHFSKGSHVGTHASNGKIEMINKNHDSLDVRNIFPDKKNSLVAYFPMENSEQDQSGRNLSVTTYSGTTFDTNSKVGNYSYEFSSGDTGILASDIANVTQEVTISLWVNQKSFNSWRRIAEKGVSGSPDWRIMSDNVENYRVELLGDSGWCGTGYNVPIKNGLWYHLVITFDGSVIKFYVNSEVKTQSNCNKLLRDNGQSLSVGGSLGGNSPFDGFIDEFSVWQVALTEEEVKKLYKAQAQLHHTELSEDWTPHWDDIVSYWKMDENWKDSSGRNNHGILNGTAGFSSNAKVGQSSGEFTGNGAYLTTDNNYVVSSANFSVSFWFFKEKTSTDAADLLRINSTNYFTINQVASTDGSNPNKLRASSRTTGYIEFFSDLEVQRGQWNHVIFTRNTSDNKQTFYLNGKLAGSINDSRSGDFELNHWEIARSWHTNSLTGKIDDIAVWKRSLSLSDISLIYNRQKQKYAASYESPIFDLGKTQTISKLEKTTDLPFMKELTASSESSSDYSLLSENLSEQLLAYWKFNDDLVDYSGQGNNLSSSGGPDLSALGLLGSGIYANGDNSGSNQYLLGSGSLLSSQDAITISAWVKYYGLSGNLITDTYSTDPSFRVFLDSSGTITYSHYDGSSTLNVATPTGIIEKGEWNHIVVVREIDKREISIYVNGVLLKNQTLAVPPTSPSTSALRILARKGNSAQLHATIDEMAVWSRALPIAEIQQLYRRGANRVKYQVRSCSDSTCSANPEWKGPGANGTTYFSELYNRSTVDLNSMFSSCFSVAPDVCDNTEFDFLGATLADNSSYNFSNFPMQNLNTRYFQYRVLMEAEENTACDGKACLPSVSAINFETEYSYYTSSPSITSSSPISINGRIRKVEHQVSGECTVKYQFSKDGTNYFFYSSDSWISATDDPNQANTINQIESELKNFITSDLLYLRAYLPSDGSQSCSLSSFKVITDSD